MSGILSFAFFFPVNKSHTNMALKVVLRNFAFLNYVSRKGAALKINRKIRQKSRTYWKAMVVNRFATGKVRSWGLMPTKLVEQTQVQDRRQGWNRRQFCTCSLPATRMPKATGEQSGAARVPAVELTACPSPHTMPGGGEDQLPSNLPPPILICINELITEPNFLVECEDLII